MKFEQYIDEWKRLYEEDGWSLSQIARHYDTTTRAVNRTLDGQITIRPKSDYDKFGEEWLRLFKEEGYTKKEIADKYKVSYTIVYRVLKKMGAKPVTNPNKLKYTQYLETWKKCYESGMSLKEVGEQHGGASAETVRQYLEREGVEMRNLSEAIRQYDINEHYFDTVDSQEKAYQLGLVFAVGSVIDNFNSYLLNLSVQQDNMELAEKIKEGLGDTTIYERNKGEITFRYSSKHLFQTLSQYGLMPNKDNESFFPNLTNELIPAFTLGLWEGRGSFPTKRAGTIQFNGSILLLTKLKVILSEIIPKSALHIIHQKEKDSYSLRIYKKDAYWKVLDWLYNDHYFFTPSRVPPFYENQKMGIISTKTLEVFGKEGRKIDFLTLKPRRLAFELPLVEIQPVLTERYHKESTFEKIYVFRNPFNQTTFKWKTQNLFDAEEGKVYTFKADIDRKDDGSYWFYRILFEDFSHQDIIYVQ